MLESIKHHGYFAVWVKAPQRSCPSLAWNLGDPTKGGHAECSFVHSLSIHSFIFFNPSFHWALTLYQENKTGKVPTFPHSLCPNKMSNKQPDRMMMMMQRISALKQIKQRVGKGQPEKRRSTYFRWASKPE